MKRHNFYLPAPLIEEMRKVAAEKDISVSELIRRVLAEWLANSKKPDER